TSGIDRQRIARDATNGVFEVTDTDQSVFSWANDHHQPYFPYDPAKAKALLDAAGWVPGADGIRRKNGQRLELQISYIGGQVIAQRLASLVQEEMRAIGIAITQKPYPTPVFFASQQAHGILNSGRYQIAYFGWISGVDPDDSSLYSCDQFPPAGQNDLFWCDPTLDQAERDAISTIDQDRRKRDYEIISRELGQQAPTVFMFSERRVDVYPKAMHGFKPSPAESANWNAYDWSMD
ncbi:MAG: ABC transporter substrate-binding protein, partial [Candidatus Eremiobacteraeota bacterium]|nr:ABC transporter substrate-binding protein [Candidatus Eremiobacteraeota bacterium]